MDDGHCRFQGCAEPAGERFSQRERGDVGGFVDGCGPGDVGVRADQEGVRWSVIGFGSVDLDAMLPVSGGLAEVCAVGEVKEDGLKRVSRFGSPKGRSTPSTRRMLSRSSVKVIGSSSS
jgi:hypothetical protein